MRIRSLGLLVVLLTATLGVASAQDVSECETRYASAVEEADARRDAAYQDAEEDRDRVLDDPEADGEDRQHAWSEYNATVDAADERYDEEVAKAEAERAECESSGDASDGHSGDASDDRSEDEHDNATDSDEHDNATDSDDHDDAERDEHLVPGTISGRYVSVDVTATGLRGFAVDGVTVLAAVEGSETWQEYEREDAFHELEADRQEARIVDGEAGNLRFRGQDIRITAPPGATFTPHGSSGHGDTRFLLEGPGYEAYVNGDRLYLDGDVLIAPEEFRLALTSERSHAIEDAVSTGAIVAEVQVNGGADARALGAVNLTSTKSAGEVVVTIEGHGEGRTLLFDIERDAIGRVEDLRVFFDGVEIEQADDMADVLNVTDGGAEYLIVVGRNSTQVLVQIPHFSVHEIRLQGSVTEILHQPPVVAIAVGAVGAALFVVGTQAWRKRRA